MVNLQSQTTCLYSKELNSLRSTVFFLLEQPTENVTFASNHPLRNGAPEGRRHFDISKFAEEQLGGAKIVGVNWFVVEAEKA